MLWTNALHLLTSDNAPTITRSNKKFLFKLDFELLLSSAMSHPSVTPAALIAKNISWKKIWDNALDYGIKGMKCTQTVLRELCRPCFGECLCVIYVDVKLHVSHHISSTVIPHLYATNHLWRQFH